MSREERDKEKNKMEHELNLEAVTRLEDAIAKLNKRAKKLGVPEIKVAIKGDCVIERESTDFSGKKVKISYPGKIVEVTGSSPKLNGWSFVAKLESENDQVLISNISGEELPKKWRKADPNNCDHCGIKRSRKATYVLKNENGKYCQVGSSCLKDFLGYHGNPESVTEMLAIVSKYSEDLSEFDEPQDYSDECGGRIKPSADTKELMTRCVAWIIANGFRPKSACVYGNEHPTSEYIVESYLDKKFLEGLKDKQTPAITAKVKKDAKAVLNWIKVEGAKAKASEYMHDLFVLTSGSRIELRRCGLVASAYPAWLKAQGAALELKKKAKPEPAEPYVGKVGERLILNELEVSKCIHMEGDYGTTTIVGFIDNEGHRFEWKASGTKLFDIGEKVNLKGTIKDQEINKWWGDKPVNRLARCVVL